MAARSIERREAPASRLRHVPRPPHWGGYLVRPVAFEFWQAGEHRLHDRFTYRKVPEGWSITRLSP